MGGRRSRVAADVTTEADVVAPFDAAGGDVELVLYNADNDTPAASSI